MPLLKLSDLEVVHFLLPHLFDFCCSHVHCHNISGILMTVKGSRAEETPGARAASHPLGGQRACSGKWPGSLFHPQKVEMALSDSRGPPAPPSLSPLLAVIILL